MNADDSTLNGRRAFLAAAGALGGGLLVGIATADDKKKPDEPGEEDVSPAEDLMREHGVLKRILMVYGEGVRRLEANKELPLKPLHDAASIIRTFIEDYHEKLEEEFLFPRFVKANVETELVATLQKQHEAGRILTERTLHLSGQTKLADAAERKSLATDLQRFIRMYEPHEAREDTILFPALHKIVTPHEYDALGEDFENREHKLFGEDGFESMVARVAEIEKALGIYDLAQFTPDVKSGA